MEGTAQPQRYCPNCGGEIRPGNTFCASCGASALANDQDPKLAASSPGADDLKRLMNSAYERSKNTYERANAQYKQYAENQAMERERRNRLQAIERECDALRVEFEAHEAFVRKAHNGAEYFLDWWLAYEGGESSNEEPSSPDLLRSVRDRAEEGLNETRKEKKKLPAAPQDEDLRTRLRSTLNSLRVKQENFASSESVFPPLVEVHERIKGLDRWSRFRTELEKFVKDLEDLLDSSSVRTAVASRARFADPGAESVKEQPCPRCGQGNSPTSRFCYNCGATLAAPSGPTIGSSVGRGPAPVQNQDNPMLWMVLSIAFAFVALFLFPPVFGGLGVYFAFRAKQAGNEGGGIAMMVVSGACLLLGMFSGALSWGF